MTICWHVDDLFIGHEDPAVVSQFHCWLAQCYNTGDKKLNVIRGPKHDLGMNLDFSSLGEVKINTKQSIRLGLCSGNRQPDRFSSD